MKEFSKDFAEFERSLKIISESTYENLQECSETHKDECCPYSDTVIKNITIEITKEQKETCVIVEKINYLIKIQEGICKDCEGNDFCRNWKPDYQRKPKY